MASCLSNQTSLLMMLATRSEVTARELAQSLGITERAVHRILKDLEAAGFISIGKRGFRNVYTVHTDRPAGHPAFPWLTVADVVRVVADWRTATAQTNGAGASAGGVRLVTARA